MRGSQINSMVRAKCNCEVCQQYRKDRKKIREVRKETNDKS